MARNCSSRSTTGTLVLPSGGFVSSGLLSSRCPSNSVSASVAGTVGKAETSKTNRSRGTDEGENMITETRETVPY